MKIEFIEREKEKEEINIGDVLLCAYKQDLQPLLIINDNGLVSAINLSTYVSEHTGDHLRELHSFIKKSWDIKKIIRKEDVLLQIKR